MYTFVYIYFQSTKLINGFSLEYNLRDVNLVHTIITISVVVILRQLLF